jgi:hypothetical protein
MKLRPFLSAALLPILLSDIKAADAPRPPAEAEESALKDADKTRVDAMKSGNREQLSHVFSDALRYAHSNGIVDSKTSFIETLTTGKTKYLAYDYDERHFTFPSPGIALMSGRAHVKAEAGGALMDSTLSFLAVWRQENGHWRFLAWQSCRLPSVPR